MLAKLAGSLYKPDGLVGIFDKESAVWILDRVQLDDICGLGPATKKHLNNMGIFSFKDLRAVPLENLLASFKSYGQILYNFARGEDLRPIIPFYEKPEVKSVGHQYTISRDIDNPQEIKQTLLKICELVARRVRAKKLEGRTVSFWFRYGFNLEYLNLTGSQFKGEGMQCTIPYTNDGLEIYKAAWKSFTKLWDGLPIRFLAVSLGNVKPTTPQNLSLLEEVNRREIIIRALDFVNDRYGEFTLQRAVLLNSRNIKRMANSFMSDRRFRI
jgi:DNA polymerase-4